MRNLFSAEIYQCGIFSAELFQCGSFSAESSVRNFHCGDSARKLPFSASIVFFRVPEDCQLFCVLGKDRQRVRLHSNIWLVSASTVYC